MTIQAAIIDKRSLILSSDLAITTEEYKSYIGVKKIFELKKNEPVGMMINGAMEFENIPLETLIGEFKKQINDFKSIEKIKDDFLKFLSENTGHTSTEEYISILLKSFNQRLEESILENGFEIAINHASRNEIPKFIKKYSNFKNEFHHLIPKEYDKKEYNLKIWEIFAYELTYEGTGIIIAGFDEDNHYPSIAVFNIYFNENGKIIYREIESKYNCKEPLIRVYAINEEAYSFITGVSEEFEESIKTFINISNQELMHNLKNHLEIKKIDNYESILSIIKDELNEYSNELNHFIQIYKHNMINFTSNNCEYLPRQLLCNLADTLIKLTALKQKLTNDVETVSSENDILIITKSENLKWAKYTEEIF